MSSEAERISGKVTAALLRYFDQAMVNSCSGECIDPKLANFYRRLYDNKKKYMLSGNLLYGNDRDIMSRSIYYNVQRNGEIVAAARFTKYPFECQEYFPDMQLNHNYVEISRLGMLNQARRFNPSMLVVISGVRDAFAEQHEGIYALVRKEEISQFRRYGLVACSSDVEIPERDGGKYMLMVASKSQLMEATESVAERIVFYQHKSIYNSAKGEENVSAVS